MATRTANGGVMAITDENEIYALEMASMFAEIESHRDKDGNFIPYGCRIPFELVKPDTLDDEDKT